MITADEGVCGRLSDLERSACDEARDRSDMLR